MMFTKKNLLTLSILMLSQPPASSMIRKIDKVHGPAYLELEKPEHKKVQVFVPQSSKKRKFDSRNESKSKKTIKRSKKLTTWKLTSSFKTHDSKKHLNRIISLKNFDPLSPKANAIDVHKNMLAVGFSKYDNSDDIIQVWNREKQTCVKRIKDISLGSIQSLRFSKCGTYLISMSFNDIESNKTTLTLWNTRTWKKSNPKTFFLNGPVTSISIYPNQKNPLLVCASGYRQIKDQPLTIIDLSSYKQYTVEVEKSLEKKRATSVAWLPNTKSNLLIVGLDNGDIIIQNMEGIIIKHLKNVHQKEVSGISIDSCGETLTTVSTDGSIVLLNLKTSAIICKSDPFDQKKSSPFYDVTSTADAIYTASTVIFPRGYSVFEYLPS